MVLEQTLVLFFEDLLWEHQVRPVSFENINIHHFKHECYENAKHSGIVVFVDKDLNTKTLKNRYGKP